jgi:hypothetical protein
VATRGLDSPFNHLGGGTNERTNRVNAKCQMPNDNHRWHSSFGIRH